MARVAARPAISGRPRRGRPAGIPVAAVLAAGTALMLLGAAAPALGAQPAKTRPADTKPAKAAVPAPPKPRPKPEPQSKPELGGTVTVVMPQALIANGLAARLGQAFAKDHKVRVAIVARRHGLGLDRLRDGKAEVAVTDDLAAERRFVAAKHGLLRGNLMYTEMMVVGPAADPADIDGMISVIEAFKAVAASASTFLGRGDGSGVALAERRLWREAGQDPNPQIDPWYRVADADMRTTLVRAARAGAYTLTDRASWLALPAAARLKALVADDPRLQLRYGVVVVNPAGHEGLNMPAATAFVAWLTGKEAQKIIEGFQLGGETPYVADAGPAR